MQNELTSLPLGRRWQQQLHPMPSVLAIVRDAAFDPARYLLIERVKEPYIGKWAHVGGKWDFGESLEEAVCREVYEETGLRTEFGTLRAVINERMHPQSEADSGGHFLLFVCELHVHEGEATEQDEGRVAWFTMDELQDLHEQHMVAPTDFQILEFCHATQHALQYVEAQVIAGVDSLEMHNFDAIGQG